MKDTLNPRLPAPQTALTLSPVGTTAALAGAARVIVPSTGLERIAREIWHQPPARVTRIANGIDTAAFAAPPRPEALPFAKLPGIRWVGTLAGLRAVKQLPID